MAITKRLRSKLSHAKGIVLQSVDSPRRDFEWRLFVARRLAKMGYASIIGSKSDISRIHEYSRDCVFLGRLHSNTSRSKTDRRLVKRMEENNTSLFFLHDEGAFYLKGTYEEAVKRIYPEEYFSSSAMAKVFFWGNAQQNVFRGHSSSDKFCVSGFPRFDLYAAKQTLRQTDKKNWTLPIRDGFILVCTRFAACNMVLDDPSMLGKRAFDIRIEGGALRDDKLSLLKEMFGSWAKVAHEFSQFIPAIANLAAKFPHIKFVIRPHPSERESFYKDAFSHFDNVLVTKEGDARSYIIKSMGIIHSECTTGVEATLAGKPCINFRPCRDIKEYEAFQVAGVSDVGEEVTNYKELERAFTKLISAREVHAVSGPNVRTLNDFLANTTNKEFATDIIIREIDRLYATEPTRKSLIGVGKRPALRNKVRKAVSQLKDYYSRDNAERFSNTKNYAFTERAIREIWSEFDGNSKCLEMSGGIVCTLPCLSEHSPSKQ